MKKSSNKLLPVSILVASVLVSGSLSFFGYEYANKMTDDVFNSKVEEGIKAFIAKQQASAQPEDKTGTVVEGDYTDDDAVLGDSDAVVTMIEFSDYQCPVCQRFHAEVFGTLKAKYIDTGKMKFVYRDLPLTSIHPNAYPAALAAECVKDQGGDEMYYVMHENIFEAALSEEMTAESLRKSAGKSGANLSKFDSCVAADKFKDEIAKDTQDASDIGFRGTPGFLINGYMMDGLYSLEAYEQAIDEALAQ
ncbi:MAG: DsbA family protein [Candidatus Peregrinibacteria bacterium]|nr:DsbA family protein [Candidatus Peregrinibacteria bacterium]